MVPVLYASQWLLTCFSCPFPVGFACRLIDVMLQASTAGTAQHCTSQHSTALNSMLVLQLGVNSPTHTVAMASLLPPTVRLSVGCPPARLPACCWWWCVQENSDAILLKACMTILAECEGDLLMQEVSRWWAGSVLLLLVRQCCGSCPCTCNARLRLRCCCAVRSSSRLICAMLCCAVPRRAMLCHTVQDFEELLTFLKVEPVQWSPQRLRRVLNAAIASPITAQDLADAEAALQQGFTGSLSRAPTFSAEAEVAVPLEEAEEEEAAAAEEAGAATSAAAAAAAGAAAHSCAASLSSQPSTAAAAQDAAAAAGGAGEDAVAAELAAAQQQIDQELLDMVLQLDLDMGHLGAGGPGGGGGGDTGEDGQEASYSNTLHSTVQGGPPPAPLG